MSNAKPTSPTVAGATVDRAAEELHNRVVPWLRTCEGTASAGIGVLVLCILWGAVGAPVLTSLLGAAFAVIAVSLAARLWESATAPPAPGFSQIAHPVEGGFELQHDRQAGFWSDRRGFLWSSRVWFAGTGCPPCQLRPETYQRLRGWYDEGRLPVFVARAAERQWWWWRNAFYWESGDCEPEDMVALLVMLERQDQQGIEWELGIRLVEPVPEAVKRLAFARNRGRCVICGSDELIQYHHVVPLSIGGSNQPQNIRLLCAGCNRR